MRCQKNTTNAVAAIYRKIIKCEQINNKDKGKNKSVINYN